MFRPALKLMLGVGLCTLGGAMLYVYFKNKQEEDELDGKILRKEITVSIVMPNEIVPVIVGRNGANIKIISEKTCTKIRFREKDENNHYCDIQGFPESVDEAKLMMLKDVQRSPTVKEEIFVPQTACGKIIGRCGESLQEICRKSLAKVSVDSGDRSVSSSTRRVLISGNRKQVEIAKKLIEEKVREDAAYRKSLEEQKREPRRSPTNSVSSTHSSLVSLSSNFPISEKLNINDNERPMEVYVSAIASPAKFWLQLVGPQSRKLDELVETMTEYYENEENQAMHKIADPYLGQIVAALFKYDGKWYRAEIVGILPNQYNPRDVVLDLYFVDYGDSEYVAPHEVFELRTDFLTLRFQAIECYLAHVKPALSNDPDLWDPQSIAKFEELTHVASWKKLISRVVTYKDRPKGGNHIRREGSPVPGVELYDTSDGSDINIAHALITQGYAVPDLPDDDKSEVLRLDGGYYGNNTLSTASSQSNVHETFIKDTNGYNNNPNNITNEHSSTNGEYNSNYEGTPTNNTNLYSETRFMNGNSLHQKIPDLKESSEQLLNSESLNGLNGNVVQDKSNHVNHNNWNNLISS